MTAINLLECLEEFVKEKTADIKLQVKVRNLNPQEMKERAADVYKMRLPKKEDQTEKVPYILLQFLTGKDDKENGEPQESDCKIRIVVATYSEDGGISIHTPARGVTPKTYKKITSKYRQIIYYRQYLTTTSLLRFSIAPV